MGLACGKTGKEVKYTADDLCSIANLFWFYVGAEWSITLLAKTVVLQKR